MHDQEEEERPTFDELDFADLLTRPPGVQARIRRGRNMLGRNQFAVPEIRLHCPNCDGERTFRASVAKIGPIEGGETVALPFNCGDCQAATKTYALLADVHEGFQRGTTFLTFRKFGEDPPYGMPLPGRVLSLAGPDRDLFLKGKRAENMGLGVGAFAYYRRVVDANWQRIVAEIIHVAEATGAPAPMVAKLKTAAGETQFSKAVDMIKEGIPESLKINGSNPLTLLYGAISNHLHDQDDGACLELAGDVRSVLAALAERTALALKEKTELHASMQRLAQARSKPKPAK